MSDIKAFDLQSISAMKPVEVPKVQGKSKDKLMEASKQFEGIFLDMVLKQMRSASAFESEFSDSSQTKIFREMLDSEYAKTSGQYNKLGIADAMYKQLSRQPVDPAVLQGVEKK